MNRLLPATGLIAANLVLCTAIAATTDIAQLKQQLITGAPPDRHAAADALADIGSGARAAVPELVAALQSGHLSGAGLDHFVGEHLPPDHPLIGMGNVVLVAILSALWFFAVSRFLRAGAWGEDASRPD